MVLIWDRAPIHRRQTIKAFLATGAAPQLHLERLPAAAPALNPGEGLWAQLKGSSCAMGAVSVCHIYGLNAGTLSSGCVANPASSKGAFKVQDFRSLCTGL